MLKHQAGFTLYISLLQPITVNKIMLHEDLCLNESLYKIVRGEGWSGGG